MGRGDEDQRNSLVTSFTLVAKLQSGALRERLARLGLNEGQALMLAELHREDGLSQTQLAERLRVEPPSVTKVVHGLERAELVDRRRDPSNGRIVLVTLTECGAALRFDLSRVWHEASEDLYGHLGRRDREILRRMLNLLESSSGRAPVA